MANVDQVFVVQQAFYYRKESEASIVAVYRNLEDAWEKVTALASERAEEYIDDYVEDQHTTFVPYPEPFNGDFTQYQKKWNPQDFLSEPTRSGSRWIYYKYVEYGWFCNDELINGFCINSNGNIDYIIDDGSKQFCYTISPQTIQ